MGSYLLFDIGGTKIRISKTTDLKSFSDPVILHTPQNFNEGFELFVKTVKEVIDKDELLGAVGGLAAVLDKPNKEIVRSPHLKDWQDKHFWKKLEEELKTDVHLENDSAIVGLGEASQIKGYEEKIIVYYSIGTGIGGTRIVEGKIDKNVFGFEPGHQIIDVDGSICPTCGIPAHLEGYVSGSGIKVRYGKEVSEITDTRVWEEIARVLSIGIHNSIIHWSPEIVILGGGVMQYLPINLIERNLKEQVMIFPKYPRIEISKLHDIGGIYGALEHLKQLKG